MSGEYNNTENKTLSRIADRSSKKVFFRKRQSCSLCPLQAKEITYKNPDLLKKFVSEGGRILPRRITNICSEHQRRLTESIKVARILALLPFIFQAK